MSKEGFSFTFSLTGLVSNSLGHPVWPSSYRSQDVRLSTENSDCDQSRYCYHKCSRRRKDIIGLDRSSLQCQRSVSQSEVWETTWSQTELYIWLKENKRLKDHQWLSHNSSVVSISDGESFLSGCKSKDWPMLMAKACLKENIFTFSK